MNEDFQKALAFTLSQEGGYVNSPNDSGGETNKGITQKVYNAFRSSNRDVVQSVKDISDVELYDIYRLNYWVIGRCDPMPAPLSIAHFDFCVNAGCTRAMKIVQALLDIDADGIFGDHTQEALNAITDIGGFTYKYLDARDKYYDRLIQVNPSQAIFKNGWHNRVQNLRNLLFT